MKSTIIKWVKWLLIYYIVAFAVVYGWKGLELLIYGCVQNRLVDNIIGAILIFSIMLNIMFIKVIIKFLNDK